MLRPMLRLCAFASGRGSNVRAIHAAIVRGDLPAELALVISNNSGSGVLAWAREHDVPATHISGKTHPDETQALLDAMADARTDVLVLAGYMKKLDPRLVQAYEGRAVNIHPGPLPRFGGHGMYGGRIHAAVLEAGVPTSAATVHRVTAEYDEGETLGTAEVEVRPDDTVESLGARVLHAEHALYWRVLRDVFVSR